MQGSLSKLERTPPHIKINVTSKSPVGDISVVTLIRTDTTLDHSWPLSVDEILISRINIRDEFFPPSVGGIGWLRPLLFKRGRGGL